MKLKSTLILLVTASGLCVLTYATLEASKSATEVQTRFARYSEFTFRDVDHCLKHGNGEHIFSRLKRPYVRHISRDLENSVYVGRDGSRLSIETKGNQTSVMFKSVRQADDQELDLLEWCVRTPNTTWLPLEHRGDM